MTVPLDAHAHIEIAIEPNQVTALGACVIAMTRSLEDASSARARADPNVVWAAGCHPGLVRALRAFRSDRLVDVSADCPVIGEVGLDGSRGQSDLQLKVFDSALRVAADLGRMVSIHSYGATAEVLAAIRRTPVPGAILHWWLGSYDDTRAAVDLGCYFSINASQARKWQGVRSLPLDRVLVETDHPFGDRSQRPSRRPGRVDLAEELVSSTLDLSPNEMRRQVWRNLYAVASEVGAFALFPRSFQVQMLAA